MQHIHSDQSCDRVSTSTPSPSSRTRPRSTTVQPVASASSPRNSCHYLASSSALLVERTRSPDAGRVSPRPHTPASRRRSSNGSRTLRRSATPCSPSSDQCITLTQEESSTIMPTRGPRSTDRNLPEPRSAVAPSFASGAPAQEAISFSNLHGLQQRGASRRRRASEPCKACSIPGAR